MLISLGLALLLLGCLLVAHTPSHSGRHRA